MNTTTITGPEPHRTDKLKKLLDKAFFVYHQNGGRSFEEDSHNLHKFLSALIRYLEFATCPAQDASKSAAHEPPTNTKTKTAPGANHLGANHQKCDRCGKPLPPHAGYYMPCWCASAASPAAACARASDTPATPSPTSQTRLESSASAAPAPAPSPAVDAPAVEEALQHAIGQLRWFIDLRQDLAAKHYLDTIVRHIDHWRERAEAKERHVDTLQQLRGLDAERIRDLEAQNAEMRKALDQIAGDKPNPPEKPESSWRERCVIVETSPGLFDIVSPNGKHEWWRKSGWNDRDMTEGGYYCNRDEAEQELSTIPTPPPEAKT